MARGARGVPSDVIAQRGKEEGYRNQLFGELQNTAGGITPDLTPAQKQAVLEEPVQAIQTGAAATRDEALRRASATGSSAALPETLSEIGRTSQQQIADAQRQGQLALANIPVQRALARASIYSPMFGSALGGENLGVFAPSQLDPTFWQQLVNSATSVASAAASHS